MHKGWFVVASLTVVLLFGLLVHDYLLQESFFVPIQGVAFPHSGAAQNAYDFCKQREAALPRFSMGCSGIPAGPERDVCFEREAAVQHSTLYCEASKESTQRNINENTRSLLIFVVGTVALAAAIVYLGYVSGKKNPSGETASRKRMVHVFVWRAISFTVLSEVIFLAYLSSMQSHRLELDDAIAVGLAVPALATGILGYYAIRILFFFTLRTDK